jgi:hypothetical protein
MEAATSQFNSRGQTDTITSHERRFDMEEVWKPVKGFEALYSVSSMGNVVRTVKYNNSTDAPLKPQKRSGYLKVTLCSMGKPRQILLHRLVADTFLGIPDGMVVNHINGITTDCRLTNLEVCSMSRNEWHKRHVLKKNSRPSFTKLTVEKASAIRRDLRAGASGVSLAAKYGVCKSNISQIKNGKNWKHSY